MIRMMLFMTGVMVLLLGIVSAKEIIGVTDQASLELTGIEVPSDFLTNAVLNQIPGSIGGIVQTASHYFGNVYGEPHLNSVGTWRCPRVGSPCNPTTPAACGVGCSLSCSASDIAGLPGYQCVGGVDREKK